MALSWELVSNWLHEILNYNTVIMSLGRRHGVEVVFIVPPVYESDRHDSVVNRILDRALALAPDVAVVDHRDLHRDPSLSEGGIHASPQYYRILAEELCRRGVVN